MMPFKWYPGFLLNWVSVNALVIKPVWKAISCTRTTFEFVT